MLRRLQIKKKGQTGQEEVKESKKNELFLKYITLKVRTVWTLETSVIIYQSTRRHIPNGLNCQQHRSENIKFRKFHVQPFRW
jgi:hypothetical protein